MKQHAVVICSKEISAAWVLILKIKPKPQRSLYFICMDFFFPKGYSYIEDIRSIGQFLLFIRSEKYNSLVAKSCFALVCLTAKFYTRQKGQELIPSNLLRFVAFSSS